MRYFMKKMFPLFYIIAFIAFCCFSLLILPIPKVSAISDVVITSNFNGSTFPDVGNFCNNADANLPNCSDFQYLKIESTILTAQNLFAADGVTRVTPMAYTTLSVIKIPDWNRIGFYGLSSSTATTNDYIRFTLTNDIGSCPPCPEPEPCADPEENSRFVQVVLDAFWKYHQVFGGAVVAIIVIFFVYRIMKGVMK